ncbi:tetratricopeptide repeat protein [Porphyromonadaceae bacterium W3.11]|nr:tetratricopeptide repeat protein [Porphyromonadaceae bacterium W3.11]
MSNKNEKLTKTDMVQAETVEAINKSEEYLKRNRTAIIILVVALIAVIGGILAYNNLYKAPRQENAYEALYKAEQHFGMSEYEVALNGNGADVVGFLQVINDYKGTDAANLAHAYAGICYARLGQPDAAIDYLKKFKAKDMMVSPTIHGAIGDCYVDMGKPEEGVSYFEEAAKMADNDLLSPIYLKKAGIVYESMGKDDKALQCYQQIIDKYYSSAEYPEAQKMIESIKLKK